MRLIGYYAAANLTALFAALCMWAGLSPIAGEDDTLRLAAIFASLGTAVLVSSGFTDHIVDSTR
jgi:hypothetical protein